MKFYHLLGGILLLGLAAPVARAQEPLTPEQKEKQLVEAVEKEVQRLSTLLDLEYWQEFYVDSTLMHDFKAMTDEMEQMQSAKVENRDLYINTQDKWMQKIDDSYKRYFTEEQWKKYWKSGGERAWKARQKRQQKK